MTPTTRALRRRFIVAFLCAASLFPTWSSPRLQYNPSVVIIDSYHNGFVWSDQELQGLTARLREAYPGADPLIEYMDAKRRADAQNMLLVKDYLERKYGGFRPDVVVALDNPALEMLFKYHEELFSGAPVVFAGVSDFSSMTVPAGVHVTGVAEVTDLAGTLGIALALHPGARHVLMVSDDTSSGRAVQREAETAVRQLSSRAAFEFLPPSTWEEAVARISALSADSLLMILSYATDRTGRSLSLAASTRLLTSRCPVPAYAPHETRLGYGVVGGLMLSGVKHGRRAGDLAVRVLSGEDPSSIPVDMRSSSVALFDYNQLVRFHIPMLLLPKGSLVINRPMTVFGLYPVFSGVMTGVVVLLVGFACLLVASVFRRRETERDLRASEANLSALIETTDDCFCSCDREGCLIAFNAAFARILHEYAGIEVRAGMRYHEHLPLSARQTLQHLTEKCVAEGKVTDEYSVDITGQQRFLEVSVYPIREGREVIGTVEFARDVTEKKRAEQALRESQEELLQARKMEAVGRLAGGITHDFNNLLTVIKAYADMAVESRDDGAALLEDLRQIQNAVGRAASLTSQLLAFSRKQVRSAHVVSLNVLIAEMTKMLGRVIGENIELRTQLSEGLWSVRADAAQIQQIIINLALNARDAMPRGGRLTIATVNSPGPGGIAPMVPASSDDSVVLTISDTGRGMDEETLSHLFEPFFTTKNEGRGTGLGLSTVYGFVKQSGGSISCTSRPGEGTTFHIRFPRADARNEVPGESVDVRVDSPGSGTVLIAEDEDAVRAFLARTLSAAGYSVTEAKNGAAALEALGGLSGVDLIVSDVVMPLMSGPELARSARVKLPHVKVLFISGYLGDSPDLQGALDDGVQILKKPFGPRELLEAVREALNGT
ncbi:MAG: ATP-binding protein [Spirochaetia bacterium]|jgi:PAS domain S-box-containing protein